MFWMNQVLLIFLSLNYFPSSCCHFFSNTICMLFTCYNYEKKNIFVSENFKFFFSSNCSFICQLQVKNLIVKRPKVKEELWTEVLQHRGHWGWIRGQPSICQHLKKSSEGKKIVAKAAVCLQKHSCVQKGLLRLKYYYYVVNQCDTLTVEWRTFKYFCQKILLKA